MELQPVILAAGRGNHMVELTNKVAKPLLPIGNKPLIHYPLAMLEKAGFQSKLVYHYFNLELKFHVYCLTLNLL